MSEYELRPIGPDEVDRLLRTASEAFGEDPHEEDTAIMRRVIDPERTSAAFTGGALVSGSALLSMRVAVPGGVVPMAGVTLAAVHPVHRSRGLLDRMMRAHLAAIHDRGEEAIAALWASEAAIYARWGYGLATRSAEMTVHSPEARLLPPPGDARPRAGASGGRLLAPPGDERPRTGAPAELLADIRAVHAAALPTRPGLVARDDLAWENVSADFEHRREGAGRLRALVSDGPEGPAGYALYRVRKQEPGGRPDDVVELSELLAATPAAAAVLWAHLLGLALSRSVHWWHAPEDHELPHMLTDARAVELRLTDGLFVRTVDVPGALAQRTYAAPVDAVLDVADEVCPWNAGRWRLSGDAAGATCARTDSAADLAVGVRELGAAYLGGTTLAALAAAGRVEEHTRGALVAASQAFKGLREPWGFERF